MSADAKPDKDFADFDVRRHPPESNTIRKV
jgi:hypothetical protein